MWAVHHLILHCRDAKIGPEASRDVYSAVSQVQPGSSEVRRSQNWGKNPVVTSASLCYQRAFIREVWRSELLVSILILVWPPTSAEKSQCADGEHSTSFQWETCSNRRSRCESQQLLAKQSSSCFYI